ncbi:uncharacterized protein LOC135389802 [Ornithodoros turicata]|uniref:uncharacterized protein LOC135389802 n=1 Tax=Ornithodoros turicata TaxID=34597 RepID=UPI003139FF28
MAMRGCFALIAGLFVQVSGRGLEFPSGHFVPKDGTYNNVNSYQHLSDPRQVQPLGQLGPQSTNGPAFENLHAGVAAFQGGHHFVTGDESRKVPNAPHNGFFQHNPALGGERSYPEGSPASNLGGALEAGGERPQQQMVVGADMSSKTHRRRLRMRHRKSFKEHHSRDGDRLRQESVNLAALDSRRRPELVRSQQASNFEQAPTAEQRTLAGLKVEYARAYIAAEEPTADAGPIELLCTVGFREYATISWTVNGHALEDFIDRSTTVVVKNEIPVKVSKIVINQLERLPSETGKFIFECTALVDSQVTKATLALGSNIEDTCTSNAQCVARGGTCSESRCICNPSQPVVLQSKHLTCRAAANLGWPCNYHEQCIFAQPNAICTDRMVCDCNLGYVRSLDGKTCDKLVPSSSLLGSACKTTADCHSAGASCVNGICACGNESMEKGGMCLPLGHLKLSLRDFAAYEDTTNASSTVSPTPAGQHDVTESSSSMMPMSSTMASPASTVLSELLLLLVSAFCVLPEYL